MIEIRPVRKTNTRSRWTVRYGVRVFHTGRVLSHYMVVEDGKLINTFLTKRAATKWVKQRGSQ